jgi:hypothetical protein
MELSSARPRKLRQRSSEEYANGVKPFEYRAQRKAPAQWGEEGCADTFISNSISTLKINTETGAYLKINENRADPDGPNNKGHAKNNGRSYIHDLVLVIEPSRKLINFHEQYRSERQMCLSFKL